ncbi:MAG: hypothetical protein ABIY70_23235 [Capsulimonas sp.]|uniref:hypothetical protein n=1 Tax=Capsulimonas sp. TaxID=2494211 RepID=UPI0032650DCE
MFIDPTATVILYFVLAVVWVVQFAQLMMFEDDSFRGHWDKLIWVAVFILVFPVAPFAFLIWKKAYQEHLDAAKYESERNNIEMK